MIDIAIDFGGTNLKIGLAEEGRIIAKASLPSHSFQGLAPRLGGVKENIALLLRSAGRTWPDCRGVGIAMPGIIDPVRHRVLSVNEKYPDAVGFDFDQWVQDQFGPLPFVMENDAKAALIGEVTYGSAKGETDAVLMIFGTGIGTAAMMNGRLVRGRHHQAGCLGGHMVTAAGGRPCSCGNRGCVEAEASHWALRSLAEALPGYADSPLAADADESIGYRSVIEASLQGDPAARALLDHLILHWSAGIVNLVHAYDPEVVIVSGGLMKSADFVVPLLVEQVHRYAWTPWGNVRFAVAEDPDSSVLLGLSGLLQTNLKE